MSVLESLIGPPISEFSSEHFPTVRNVLQFYSQFWGSHGSESQREQIVAEKLIEVYDRSNIPIISDKGIRNKIGRDVKITRAILKSFHAKVKSPTMIDNENKFHSTLEQIFEIRRTILSSDGDETTNEEDSYSSSSNSIIEIDNQFGNYL